MNQVQATGAEDASKEVVPEEVVTKDMEDKANSSTAQNKHHISKTSREKLMILAQS